MINSFTMCNMDKVGRFISTDHEFNIGITKKIFTNKNQVFLLKLLKQVLYNNTIIR